MGMARFWDSGGQFVRGVFLGGGRGGRFGDDVVGGGIRDGHFGGGRMLRFLGELVPGGLNN